MKDNKVKFKNKMINSESQYRHEESEGHCS